MNIHCISSQSALPISEEKVERLVEAFLKWKSIRIDEVTLHFVNKEEISHLHDLYFNDPSPTDCISFPIDDPMEEGYIVLGEIFVCPEVALDYLTKKGGDPYEEVSLYITHGLLHLLGFDDQNPEDIQIMRGEEKSAINYFREHDLLLSQ
ncbi:rRNA maturation RNase YbeY [Candidatus Neptunochlamydia vexilliferae]|uniref:rRNA maturation RNase YbeY n=1 Tax=Candidatus Neptunichlamydia vexilliferae TaxID=1651774 RepID=UPI001891E719|nr:rRNA maturation RNase YbeY [Candidatus Neptunochlamydia vexilliferae]